MSPLFDFLRPQAIRLLECTCGHLKYTHRYLGAKLACTAEEVQGARCPCPEYTEIANAPEA